MSANTILDNKLRHDFHPDKPVWVFGYGSLIYKVDFPYLAKAPAFIEGYVRRFWQGSHDHRGTPDAPGRVVTLIAESNAVCNGMAYLVEPQVFEHLDYREKNGYLRITRDLVFVESGDRKEGIVYIADEDNSAFLGAASELEIAEHIARSFGPSGSNADYLLELAEVLRGMGIEDDHVFAIEKHLLNLM